MIHGSRQLPWLVCLLLLVFPAGIFSKERLLSATPAILHMEKAGGKVEEMCLTNFFISGHRIPTSPDPSAMAPIVDVTPWDGCPAYATLKSAKGSFGIIDADSVRCTVEEKVANMEATGAKGVILYSAAGRLPLLGTSTSVSMPVLAVGPNRYDQLKSHFPVKKAVAYLPKKSLLDPSLLLILAAAIFAFTYGGMLGGRRTLQELAASRSDDMSALIPSESSDITASLTEPPSTSSLTSNPSNLIFQSSGPSVNIQPHITVPMIFQMVALMSMFLMAMYTFSDYIQVLDFYMYYILMPDVIVEFFDPFLAEYWGDNRIRPFTLWLAALGVTYFWVQNRYAPGAWIFQNLISLLLTIMILKEVRFPSMETITWALGLLFVYDIFFVFVTPYFTSDGVSVMEKVALSSSRPRSAAGGGSPAPIRDGGARGAAPQEGMSRPPTWPILLVVPNYYNPLKVCGIPGFNALGLGDIFWPGLVASYCYAFDKRARGAAHHPYFKTAIVSYAAGLFMAMVASMVMEMGQPALLYIVPAVLAPVMYLAKQRREEQAFWTGSILQAD